MTNKTIDEVIKDFEVMVAHEDFEGADCAAHNEGLFCCLDTEHERYKEVVKFIRSLLEANV